MAYRRTERVVARFNARREAIVDAARELASESGMEAVQIATVAMKADIAAGTVYRYFPSKSELVAALVEGVTARELAIMKRAAAAAPGPLSALAATIVTFAARSRRQNRLIWAVLAEPVDHDIGALRISCRRTLAAEFGARIAAAIAGANLPEQDAALAAVALLGGLLEGLVGPLAPEAGDEWKLRDSVQALTLNALRGLGVNDARARGLVVQAAWPKEVAA
jgi:AcrR family transcriptional regulator